MLDRAVVRVLTFPISMALVQFHHGVMWVEFVGRSCLALWEKWGGGGGGVL